MYLNKSNMKATEGIRFLNIDGNDLMIIVESSK